MLKSDNIVSSRQFFIARVVAWAMILVLGIRYFQIQIIEHELYRLKSNTNRISVLQKMSRGLILDRKGEILVTIILFLLPSLVKCRINQQFKLIADYIESDSSIIQ